MKAIEFQAMGCKIEAMVDTPDPQIVEQLWEVPKWFEEWENALSRFRPGSELNQLNRSQGASIQVSPILWQVITFSFEAARKSNGLVVPSVLNSLELAGYNRNFEDIPPQRRSLQAAVHPQELNIDRISLQSLDRKVTLPKGIRLDFGGIAKGWAAHQAMKRLKSRGAAFVNAGGDIAVSGPLANGGLWPVGILDPFNPGQHIETVYLARNGIATSGRDYRRWIVNDSWQHHIIDPFTGIPAMTDVMTASVIAPTVTEAEVAAKVVLIKGSKAGLDWIEARPHLSAIVVSEDRQIHYSKRITKYLGGHRD